MKALRMGTPKTMDEAVVNGIIAGELLGGSPSVLTSHVKDFIRNRMATLMLSDEPKEVLAVKKMMKLLGVE